MINTFDRTLLKMDASSSCLFINSLALEEKGKKNNALHALTAFVTMINFTEKLLLVNYYFNQEKNLKE